MRPCRTIEPPDMLGAMPQKGMPMSGARRTGIRAGVDTVLFYFGLVLFGVMSLMWSVPAGVLHAVLPRRIGTRIGQFGIMAGFRIFIGAMRLLGLFEVDLKALDQLRAAGPLIIAANHPSLLDAVMIISRLPEVVCITKASLWDNWFLGGGIRLAAYIRNDSPRELTRLAVAELRAGRQLLIFPEGTRTEGGGPVGPFKGGFVIMARTAGVPVQTVLLDGGARYLTKGWPLFSRPDVPLVFRARLGRRFEVNGPTKAFTADLERYFAEALRRPVAEAA
jgi:1-acyl-sn-glycerol-3-phosphate acyltransferase